MARRTQGEPSTPAPLDASMCRSSGTCEVGAQVAATPARTSRRSRVLLGQRSRPDEDPTSTPDGDIATAASTEPTAATLPPATPPSRELGAWKYGWAKGWPTTWSYPSKPLPTPTPEGKGHLAASNYYRVKLGTPLPDGTTSYETTKWLECHRKRR